MNLTAVLTAEHPDTVQFRQLAFALTHAEAELAHLLALLPVDRQTYLMRRAMLRLDLREKQYLVRAILIHQAKEAVN